MAWRCCRRTTTAQARRRMSSVPWVRCACCLFVEAATHICDASHHIRACRGRGLPACTRTRLVVSLVSLCRVSALGRGVLAWRAARLCVPCDAASHVQAAGAVAARREAGKAKGETKDKEEAVAVARNSGNSSIKSPMADSSVARGTKAAPPEGTDPRRVGADENTAAKAAAASGVPELLPKPLKPVVPKGDDVLSSVQKSSLTSPAFKSNIAQSNFLRKKEKIKESKDIDQNA